MSPTLLEIVAIVVLVVVAWQIGKRLVPMNTSDTDTDTDEHTYHRDEKQNGDGA